MGTRRGRKGTVSFNTIATALVWDCTCRLSRSRLLIETDMPNASSWSIIRFVREEFRGEWRELIEHYSASVNAVLQRREKTAASKGFDSSPFTVQWLMNNAVGFRLLDQDARDLLQLRCKNRSGRFGGAAACNRITSSLCRRDGKNQMGGVWNDLPCVPLPRPSRDNAVTTRSLLANEDRRSCEEHGDIGSESGCILDILNGLDNVDRACGVDATDDVNCDGTPDDEERRESFVTELRSAQCGRRSLNERRLSQPHRRRPPPPSFSPSSSSFSSSSLLPTSPSSSSSSDTDTVDTRSRSRHTHHRNTPDHRSEPADESAGNVDDDVRPDVGTGEAPDAGVVIEPHIVECTMCGKKMGGEEGYWCDECPDDVLAAASICVDCCPNATYVFLCGAHGGPSVGPGGHLEQRSGVRGDHQNTTSEPTRVSCID